MPETAMLGAGSIISCKTLMTDVMASPALESDCSLLISQTESKFRKAETFAKQMIRGNSRRATIEASTDHHRALECADHIAVMIQIGGTDGFSADHGIPMQYGVDQCIVDGTGTRWHLEGPQNYSGPAGYRK